MKLENENENNNENRAVDTDNKATKKPALVGWQGQLNHTTGDNIVSSSIQAEFDKVVGASHALKAGQSLDAGQSLNLSTRPVLKG